MIRPILRNAGIQPRRLLSAIRGWPRYVRDRRAFKKQASEDSFAWGKELPILNEWEETSGSLGAYFYQDQAVARWIYQAQPTRHVDVGSRLDGFIGHLSVFRNVDVIDIREQPFPVSQVNFHQLDLMKKLPPEWLECTDSLSCLHTIEHFGLGRYGDPLDPNGYLKGIAQLKRMVQPLGRIYLSTPIGPQRVEFNAHRIFSPQTLRLWFKEGWEIEKCAVMDESNHLTESPCTEILENFNGNLGLGMIVARKTAS
jgi:Caenorhabditis protein of unknown function, DUF268